MATSNRVTNREAVGLLAQKWNSSSMNTHRRFWNAYANSVVIINQLGKKVRLSGFNHFIRSNLPRTLAGHNITLFAPTK